jgi:hypothetical protein
VFGTDVMVTVAKSFDAPVKLLWPKDLFAEQLHFSMLGLGDIVIPGTCGNTYYFDSIFSDLYFIFYSFYFMYSAINNDPAV